LSFLLTVLFCSVTLISFHTLSLPTSGTFFLKYTYGSNGNDENSDQKIEDTFEPPPDENSGDSNSNSNSGDQSSGNDNSGDSNSHSKSKSKSNSNSGDQNSGDSNSNSNSGDQSSGHEATEIGTVYVKVDNPYGNGLKPSDFTLKIRIEGSGDASPKTFKGDSHGTDIKFTGDALYSLKDTWTDLGYTAHNGGDCPLPGEKYPPTFTCHITFEQNKPTSSSSSTSSSSNTHDNGSGSSGKTSHKTKSATLNVINLVINDNGGNLQDKNFTVNISGTSGPKLQSFEGNANGTAITFANEGNYAVNQSTSPLYNTTYSVDCIGTINYGQEKTCTITSDDVGLVRYLRALSYLRIIANTINDDGGTRRSSDFTLTVTSNNGSSSPLLEKDGQGTIVTLGPGTYSITGKPVSGYQTTYSPGCSGSLLNGESKLCYVTNNDKS
jgi:prealbumin domain-containing protein